MGKDRTEKNKQESFSELIFKDIAEIALQQARDLLQTTFTAKQGVELVTQKQEVNLSVYELHFLHDENRISSFQVRLSAWAHDSLTHIQVFRKPIKTELERRIYHLSIVAERLFAVLAYAAVILISFTTANYFVLALSGFFAFRYILNLFKHLEWDRPNPFLAEDEAIITEVLTALCETELGDTASDHAERSEILSLEDPIEQKSHS